jgi:hypothetical protein
MTTTPRWETGGVFVCKQAYNGNAHMQPDYSEQLKAIVVALNHSTTPAWLIAVFSALLGVMGGIVAQTILLRISDRYQRNRMKRVLYTDLVGYFLFIYSTLTDKHYTGEMKLKWQQQQFEQRINFSGEQYMQKQPDIYMQLGEHRAASELYLWLHHTVDKTLTSCSNPDMFCQIFSEYVAEGYLSEKCLKKYGGDEQAAKVMSKVKEARALLENIKKQVATGAIKVVDGFQEDN